MPSDGQYIFCRWEVYLFGKLRLSVKWCSGAMGSTLDLQSTGRGFKSYSGKSCVTTLGKLFTPVCLCHQAV